MTFCYDSTHHSVRFTRCKLSFNLTSVNENRLGLSEGCVCVCVCLTHIYSCWYLVVSPPKSCSWTRWWWWWRLLQSILHIERGYRGPSAAPRDTENKLWEPMICTVKKLLNFRFSQLLSYKKSLVTLLCLQLFPLNLKFIFHNSDFFLRISQSLYLAILTFFLAVLFIFCNSIFLWILGLYLAILTCFLRSLLISCNSDFFFVYATV